MTDRLAMVDIADAARDALGEAFYPAAGNEGSMLDLDAASAAAKDIPQPP